jgi:O-6-methylguanine DNA methyltransferase
MAVWDEVSAIPWGSWSSYSAITLAVALKRGAGPSNPRAVGRAVGANQTAILVPCHRVIGKGGTLGGFGYEPELKAALLELEGITGVSP